MSTTHKRQQKDSNASSSKKRSKKAKIQAEDQNNVLTTLIKGDLLCDLIFSFLDVKDLMSIVFCSKDMVNKLTYEHAIRSGMMHNRYTKTTMERVADNLDLIHVPSPHRLLRLLNGKRCERCNDRKVNHVFGISGLFLCCNNSDSVESCVKGAFRASSTMQFYEWAQPPTFLKFVPHYFLPAQKYWVFRQRAWENTTTMTVQNSNKDEEMRGPLITDADIQLLNYNEEQIQKLLVQRRQQDPNRPKAETIREIYQACLEQANRWQQERDRQRNQKMIKAIANKKKKIQEMLNYLSSCWDQKPWRDIALTHSWSKKEAYCHRRNSPLLKFRIDRLQELMHPFIVSPRRATSDVLKDIADQLSATFSFVYEQDLHNLSFFNDDDRLEKIWKENLLASITVEKRLIPLVEGLERKIWKQNERVTVQNVLMAERQGMTLQEHKKMDDKIFNELLGQFWGLERCARPGVLSSMVIPPERQALAEALADGIWYAQYHLVDYFAIRERYRYCCKNFPALFQAALDFLCKYNLDENTDQVNFALIQRNFATDRRAVAFLMDRNWNGAWKRALKIQQHEIR